MQKPHSFPWEKLSAVRLTDEGRGARADSFAVSANRKCSPTLIRRFAPPSPRGRHGCVPHRQICRSSLALPLGELSAKLTERVGRSLLTLSVLRCARTPPPKGEARLRAARWCTQMLVLRTSGRGKVRPYVTTKRATPRFFPRNSTRSRET